MLLNNILPAPRLQPFIRLYRIIDFDFSRESLCRLPVKAYRPRIEHCLQFTPFDKETVDYQDQKGLSFSTAVFGQQTALSYRTLGKRFLNFQVVFQPGVLHGLLKLPLDEFVNIYTDAEPFFGGQIRFVNEQLATCFTYQEMISKVEGFLWEIVSRSMLRPHPVNRIARLLTSTHSFIDMERLASQANLSYRQFDRAFKTNTGIAPKDFRMLVKLDQAYLLKNRNPQSDWLSIALESGFYDYQHLARNYIKYLGHLPTEFYLLEQLAPERYFGDFEH